MKATFRGRRKVEHAEKNICRENSVKRKFFEIEKALKKTVRGKNRKKKKIKKHKKSEAKGVSTERKQRKNQKDT